MEELKLPASDEALGRVLDNTAEYLDKNGCPELLKVQILMAAEEIFVNIAHYAYEGRSGIAIIQTEVTENPKTFHMVFRDRGIRYDPLTREEPDITLSAEERTVGGLGIYLVKKSMDKLSYQYEDGWNVLQIEKQIEQS